MRLEDNAGVLHASASPDPCAVVLVTLPAGVLAVAATEAQRCGLPVAEWVAGAILARAKRPMTPAEKQRAYRARKAQQQ